jgi:hypothetical protein
VPPGFCRGTLQRGNKVAFAFKLGVETVLEARGGVEPPIKVLQTFALPLGDRARVTSILPERKTPASPYPVET